MAASMGQQLDGRQLQGVAGGGVMLASEMIRKAMKPLQTALESA